MISTPSRGKFDDTCEQTSFRTGRIPTFGRNLEESQCIAQYWGSTIKLMSGKVFGSVYTQLAKCPKTSRARGKETNLRNDLSQPSTSNVSFLSFGNWTKGEIGHTWVVAADTTLLLGVSIL
jgi:hypothetical protein